jgi:rare lipoprotein A
MSKKFALGLLLILASLFSSSLWSKNPLYATYYANRFHNKKTASGELYLKDAYTCAHKTLPFGTYLLVKNTENGKEVIVKVNDRMARRNKAKLDLSYAAAKELDMIRHGYKRVEISILDETMLALKRNELLVSNQ